MARAPPGGGHTPAGVTEAWILCLVLRARAVLRPAGLRCCGLAAAAVLPVCMVRRAAAARQAAVLLIVT